MSTPKFPMRRVLSIIAFTGCLLSSVPALTWAQGLPGLTIFSGVERKDELNYKLDYGRRDMWDRYQLRIPAKKLQLGVSQFKIDYPDYYSGTFDTKQIQVLVNEKPLPLQEVNWDKKGHSLLISLKNPIEEAKKVDIVLDNVKNPDFGGTYYFNCSIINLKDVPLPAYIGTWIITID